MMLASRRRYSHDASRREDSNPKIELNPHRQQTRDK